MISRRKPLSREGAIVHSDGTGGHPRSGFEIIGQRGRWSWLIQVGGPDEDQGMIVRLDHKGVLRTYPVIPITMAAGRGYWRTFRGSASLKKALLELAKSGKTSKRYIDAGTDDPNVVIRPSEAPGDLVSAESPSSEAERGVLSALADAERRERRRRIELIRSDPRFIEETSKGSDAMGIMIMGYPGRPSKKEPESDSKDP